MAMVIPVEAITPRGDAVERDRGTRPLETVVESTSVGVTIHWRGCWKRLRAGPLETVGKALSMGVAIGSVVTTMGETVEEATGKVKAMPLGAR